MGAQKSLSLLHRLESPHPPFPHPGHLMRLLCPIIGVPRIIVDNVWHQLPVSNAITAQFVGYDFPGLAAMTAQ